MTESHIIILQLIGVSLGVLWVNGRNETLNRTKTGEWIVAWTVKSCARAERMKCSVGCNTFNFIFFYYCLKEPSWECLLTYKSPANVIILSHTFIKCLSVQLLLNQKKKKKHSLLKILPADVNHMMLCVQHMLRMWLVCLLVALLWTLWFQRATSDVQYNVKSGGKLQDS